ncbi:hypothetical protein C1645_821492 [Glomus cerebriforme]|uniref:MULE transposase domain-containing protein n=1 Tax=Glomus cerebriforme TaxID=658196 RepID=A0A397T687_9GLOM|nr:hypothetical protein C1645_821492 [Glomus cerebriforme]
MQTTGNRQPVIIFTDADSAMQVAISSKYSRTIVRHYFENRWTKLMVKFSEIKKYLESMNRIIKIEANSGSSLCQLHLEIELHLKDEAKYSRLQEFCNINPTAEISLVSNTIFKFVDKICKKYLTSNSLAL